MFRTPYNYDRAAVSRATGLSCPDESLAQQQFKDDSNPNLIMQRFSPSQRAEFLNRAATIGESVSDFTGVDSYQDALNRVMAAQERFMELPASVRSRFDNDPAKLLNFVADDRNRDEAVKLGLLKTDLSPSGVRAPRSEREPVGGKSGDAPATPPAKKPSKLKTRLSELLNNVPDDEEI